MVEGTHPPPRPAPDASLAIETLVIEAFRGLKNVTFENLGRFNLLVGSNNAGKTTVLEALAIKYNAHEIYEWLNIVRAREIRSLAIPNDNLSTVESLRWLFPMKQAGAWDDIDPDPISLRTLVNDRTDRFEATCQGVRGVIPQGIFRDYLGPQRHLNEKDSIEDTGINIHTFTRQEQNFLVPEEYNRDFVIWSQLGVVRSGFRRTRPFERVQYIAPYAHRSTSQNLRKLTQSSKDGTRDDIDALLRDLDKRISGVEIVTSEDGRIPRIAIRYRSGALLPIAVLGDGTRRALSIALALRSASHGILLVDEIEAALHVNVLDRVYRWLDEGVQTYNVQVFATTHSLEAVTAIIAAKSPNSRSELSAYTVDSNEFGGVKRYTGGMLHRLVYERGLDIRN